MTPIAELLEKRAPLLTQLQQVTDKAEAEKRDLTNEEDEKHKRIWGDVQELNKKIAAGERKKEADRLIAGRTIASREGAGDQTREERRLASEGFRNLLLHTRSEAINADKPAHEAYQRAIQAGYRVEVEGESRDLQMGQDVKGGYLVSPPVIVAGILKNLDDLVIVRRYATARSVENSDSLGVVTMDRDIDDPDWTTELRTGQEAEGPEFGMRELHPHPMALRVKFSEDFLRKVPNIVDFVTGRIAYRTSVREERAFLTGDGVQKPLGIFTPHDNGIPLSRDVDMDNEPNKPTADGLQNAKFALKAGYRGRARWMFHRDTMREIVKLKDGENRYIWSGSMVEGEPDRLLALPVHESEFAPNTLATGQYVGVLGDFSYYWIADDINYQLKRLDELYAETNQIGFILRRSADAQPVLAEAFVRVKLG